MRAIIFLAVLLIVCAGAFRVATVLSPDAVGMAVGMLFGVLAGIPTALLMRAAERPKVYDEFEIEDQPPYRSPVVVSPSPSPSRVGWPERISEEDAYLYTYELSAYSDTSASPRRIPLPQSDKQRAMRQWAITGKIRKLSDDDGSALPPGVRKLERINGKIVRV